MAKLEDLIKEISEPALRARIASELAKLKAKKRFGLVFEEHIPETIQLPDLPIKVGVRVVQKIGRVGETFVVVGVNGSKVEVRPERGGEKEIFAKPDVAVIKRFGESVYPSLSPVDSITRAENKPYHVVVNAENFHALQLLLYCYESKVDVIYIDPPYNTGARDWKYNNNYVDTNDQWRHSKWLSMMKKRLILARRLLKPNGVLIATSDENEDATLTLLLREVFPDADITAVPIIHNPRGIQGDNFSYCHELAHFVIRKGLKRIGARKIPKDQQEASPLRNWGGESTRDTAKTAFYPIYFKKGKLSRVGEVPPPSFHPKRSFRKLSNGEIEFWPIDSEDVERKWRYAKDSVRRIAHLLELREIGGKPQILLRKETGPYKTVWTDSKFDASTHGTRLLNRILDTPFPFPKSLYAVLECLEATIADRPNALVLDFFAGSGTTLHATALLNSMDGGSRQCILVTNNEVAEDQAKELRSRGMLPGDSRFEEHGICEAVTWPRCKRVIEGKRGKKPLEGKYLTGRKLSEGFPENAVYVRLGFLDPHEVSRGESFEAIVPILWLMAGTMGELKLSRGSNHWFIPKESPYAVLLKEDHLREFTQALKTRSDVTHVFLVTDSVEAFREMADHLGHGRRYVQLYRSYLENFRINLERSL
jgi:adenine-specific DNA-methyltransferase